ncbi:hypothetical protein, partial [Clostridium perfringens]|uniref:hypothetical protein n=1 Tax=Clostridium perfringens TaxID=1502 RepID=UPI00322210A2
MALSFAIGRHLHQGKFSTAYNKQNDFSAYHPALCRLLRKASANSAPNRAATILAATPAATPEPTLLPLSLGLVMQGNYLGQVIGPVALSAIVA